MKSYPSIQLSPLPSPQVFTLQSLMVPDPGLGKQLIKAVRSSNVEEVKRLLAQGADVNYTEGGRNLTPLMLASAYIGTDATNAASTAIIRILLDKGAEIDMVNSAGNTALMLSIVYGTGPGITDLLLERGADPKIKNNEDKNAYELCSTDVCRNLINVYNEMREYGTVEHYASTKKFLQEAMKQLPGDVQGLIYVRMELNKFCEQLNNPKYTGYLWAIADILGVQSYKDMTKSDLCRQISAALAQQDFR